ncbi:MAG: hypothetical protein ACXWB0_05620 [Sulfuricurvum sp.]
MFFQIFDTFVIVLFVLFLVYIFRGYHLSKRQDEGDIGSSD